MATDHLVSVEHVGDDRFLIGIRGHAVFVDQPREAGGLDTAPTPTELFAAALASCVAHYARRYLARHDLPQQGLGVTASFSMGARPARVDRISICIAVPAGLTDDQRQALRAVASHCTVHNTLDAPPAVRIELDAGPDTAAA